MSEKIIKILNDILEERVSYSIRLLKQEPLLLMGLTIKPLTIKDYLNCNIKEAGK